MQKLNKNLFGKQKGATSKIIMYGNQRLNRFFSIQFVIAFTSILLAIIPMSYTALSLYSKYAKELVDTSQVFTSQILDQLRYNLDEFLSQSIETNREIESLLSQNKMTIDSEFQKRINSFYATRNDILNVSVVDMKGSFLFSLPGNNINTSYKLLDEPWFDLVSEDNLLYYITEPHVQNMYMGSRNWAISVVQVIDVNDGNEFKKAILIVDISIKKLDELCNSLNIGGSGYVFLTNANQKIIYHPQQALIYAGLKKEINSSGLGESELVKNANNDEVLITTKSLSFVDWKLIGVAHIDPIAQQNNRIFKEIMDVLPVVIIAIILISWFISGMISSPIKELNSKMQLAQKGDFDANIHLKNSEKEVMELADSYNILLIRIKNLMEEKRIEHEAKRQSELNALQAQINPHFLYNTLDSIMWMAESGQNDEVVEMVTALARLFRISISKGRKTISVANELEHARNYLLIQKIRYKEKFTFIIHASEEVKQLKTLKLILQPIIENAIYHGIEYMVDEGEIQINVFTENDCLVYEIIDNGLGMDQEMIQKLIHTKDMEVEPTQGGSGVGVRNVDERIKLSYGEQYGLNIHSEIEVGTTVRIVLPILESESGGYEN